MDQIVVAGQRRGIDKIVAALEQLSLRGPPETCVVVANRDHDDTVTAVRFAAAQYQRVIVVTMTELPCSVVEAIAAVVDDVLDWDETTIPAIDARVGRWREIAQVLESPDVKNAVLGLSPAHLDAVSQLIELALHSNAPVLLTGETGTGKELMARLLHRLGDRRASAFVIVDCTTIVPTLSGSELFGHERGAFTGASSTRTGAFAAADGGTLFLDEIGDLALPIQAELLRVVQEGTYKRVGGDRWLHTNFRLVSATHRDLRSEVSAGQFRQDLFHRITSGVVELPPLRERAGDVELLFAAFLSEAMHGTAAPAITEPVRTVLRRREYPGNLRDLRQLALQVAARHAGPGRITLGDLPRSERLFTTTLSARPTAEDVATPASASGDVEETIRHSISRLVADGHQLRAITRLVTDLAVDVALDESGGSTRAAARRLGVTERAIQLRRAALRSVDLG